jgi:hypothetical protein
MNNDKVFSLLLMSGGVGRERLSGNKFPPSSGNLRIISVSTDFPREGFYVNARNSARNHSQYSSSREVTTAFDRIDKCSKSEHETVKQVI